MKLSLITVALNCAETIAETLSSVAVQSLPPFEHIVIDGASTDATVAIVKSRGTSATRLISEPDRGIYDAMNKGIGVATGDVIGFLNADDYYVSPAIIATIAKVFEDPGVDACYGDLIYVRKLDTDAVVRYWRSSVFTPGDFARGWCPPHPTFYVRRAALDLNGRFDTRFRLAADVELMLRLLEVQRLNACYIPQVLVAMRMGGATNANWSNIIEQNREIWRALGMHTARRSLARYTLGKIRLRVGQVLARSDWPRVSTSPQRV